MVRLVFCVLNSVSCIEMYLKFSCGAILTSCLRLVHAGTRHPAGRRCYAAAARVSFVLD